MFLERVDAVGLARGPGAESSGQRALVAVTAPGHFLHLSFMTTVKCSQSSFPTQGLGVMGVAFLIFSENRPNGMELTVFPQEMGTAKFLRWNVPDAQDLDGRKDADGEDDRLQTVKLKFALERRGRFVVEEALVPVLFMKNELPGKNDAARKFLGKLHAHPL